MELGPAVAVDIGAAVAVDVGAMAAGWTGDAQPPAIAARRIALTPCVATRRRGPNRAMWGRIDVLCAWPEGRGTRPRHGPAQHDYVDLPRLCKRTVASTSG